MRRLVVIHFNPIELYPPVLNWLNFLAENAGGEVEVRVLTMSKANGPAPFLSPAGNIRIIRSGVLGKGSIRNWLSYLSFYATAVLTLVRWRPDTVLYYETLSAFPAWFFKKYVRPSSDLYIHYHEYTSPAEYQGGMRLTRWIHRLERKLYKKAKWLSQTNDDRLGLFKADIGGGEELPFFVLPNYPPASWLSGGGASVVRNTPLRIVYVGALSLDTMYTREMAEWVIGRSGEVVWDIYSDNITPEAMRFLETFRGELIRFKKGVNYFNLPVILGQYDVGVILYNGHIPNYIYNAPNKLFEYMACGLDVWFPDVMKGCLAYRKEESFPKVLGLDFTRLSGVDPVALADRTGLSFVASSYCSENVLSKLFQTMKP